MSDDKTATEVTVTKNPEGYVTIDISTPRQTIYVEVGATRFSGYIKGEHTPILFEGEIDAAE